MFWRSNPAGSMMVHLKGITSLSESSTQHRDPRGECVYMSGKDVDQNPFSVG